VLAEGTTATGTITGALHQYTGSCGTTNGPDVVYQISHSGGDLFLGVVSTAFNPTVYLSTSCGSSTYCNDNAYAGVNASVISVSGLAAGTYYVIVDGWNAAASGNFALRFQRSPCTTSTRIAANGNYDGSTVGQGNDTAGACGGASASDVLYYLALCGARSVRATTCAARTNFDTVLSFRTGDCADSAEISCNDNDPLCASGMLRSTATAALPQGLGFLAVDGFYGAQGNYRVTISGM